MKEMLVVYTNIPLERSHPGTPPPPPRPPRPEREGCSRPGSRPDWCAAANG